MKVTHEVRYDAPVDEVYAMLTDPGFRTRATHALGSTSCETTVADGVVTIRFTLPVDGLPGFARKIVGPRLSAVQKETWDPRTHTADFAFSSPGMPAGITGTRRLVAEDGGTLDTFSGEAVAKFPLIGGKIEKLMADRLADGWNNEQGVGAAWLEGER